MQRGCGVRGLITTHVRCREIKRQARLLALRHQPTSLEIGAAGHPVYSDGWIVTNLPELDALDERQSRSLFRPCSINRTLPEHDSRNVNGEVAHASLIVDAFPAAVSPEKRCRDMGPGRGAPIDDKCGGSDA